MTMGAKTNHSACSEETFYTDRLVQQLDGLRASRGLRGVAFFPQANLDATPEELAKSASAMLDSYLSGNSTDITGSPRAS